jgi:hypothetical protein
VQLLEKNNSEALYWLKNCCLQGYRIVAPEEHSVELDDYEFVLLMAL